MADDVQGAFPDDADFARYMRAFNECRTVAIKVYAKDKTAFPNLPSMFTLDAAYTGASSAARADAMENQLEFLKQFLSELSTDNVVDMPRAPQPPTAPINTTTTAPAAALPVLPLPPYMSATVLSYSQAEVMPYSQVLTRDFDARIMQIPAMPEELIFRKHLSRQIGEGVDVTNPHTFWNFCWTQCWTHNEAIGPAQLCATFTTNHPNQQGHAGWFTRKKGRAILFELYRLADVKVKKSQGRLLECLDSYWNDNRKELLDILSGWLDSGAADSLQSDGVLPAALQCIRSARIHWPDNGDDIDTSCLLRNIVEQSRLLEEWTASKTNNSAERREALKYFEAENKHEVPETKSRKAPRQLAAARGFVPQMSNSWPPSLEGDLEDYDANVDSRDGCSFKDISMQSHTAAAKAAAADGNSAAADDLGSRDRPQEPPAPPAALQPAADLRSATSDDTHGVESAAAADCDSATNNLGGDEHGVQHATAAAPPPAAAAPDAAPRRGPRIRVGASAAAELEPAPCRDRPAALRAAADAPATAQRRRGGAAAAAVLQTAAAAGSARGGGSSFKEGSAAAAALAAADAAIASTAGKCSRFTRDQMLALYQYTYSVMPPASKTTALPESFWGDAFVRSLMPSFKQHLHHAKQRSVQAGCREMYVRDHAPIEDVWKSPADFEVRAGSIHNHVEMTLSAILWSNDHLRYVELSCILLNDMAKSKNRAPLVELSQKTCDLKNKNPALKSFGKSTPPITFENLLEFLAIDLRIEHGDSIAWVAEQDLGAEYDRMAILAAAASAIPLTNVLNAADGAGPSVRYGTARAAPICR